MATADQVKALVRSHADGDDGHFYAVAMQVAARAAKAGQAKFAQDLKELVDAAKAASGQSGRKLRPVPVTQPRGVSLACLPSPTLTSGCRTSSSTTACGRQILHLLGQTG
jgi:hypothetical protein